MQNTPPLNNAPATVPASPTGQTTPLNPLQIPQQNQVQNITPAVPAPSQTLQPVNSAPTAVQPTQSNGKTAFTTTLIIVSIVVAGILIFAVYLLLQG